MKSLFQKSLLRKTICGGLILTCILCGLTLSISHILTSNTIAQTNSHKLANLPYKIWSHAGYHEQVGFHLNSIESFDKAKKNNAKGLELDVFYDLSLKKFVVSHDSPYKIHKHGLLFLDSVLARYQNDYTYWLDFKNLKHINQIQSHEACDALQMILKKYKIQQNNILIESQNLSNLRLFTKKGFYTSWWITPYSPLVTSIFRDCLYRYHYLRGDYSSLSMSHKYYYRIKNTITNIPINLWTINEIPHLQKVNNIKNIKIILSDRNWFNKK